MDSPTLLRSACFCDLHASTSAHHDVLHHDVYTGGNLLSKFASHPRMTSLSAASFSTLHSSVRYLLFFYTLLGTVYFVVSRRCMM